MCVLILKPTLESLHVCSFHKPHMDPPLSLYVCFSTKHTWINQWSLHVCSFRQTTHGSTSGHCMCVLSTNHIWIKQSHCMCVLSTNHIWIQLSNCMFVLILKPQTSTRVIACVFFPQTTYRSTSGHCMCVFFTNHTWINH